MKAIKCVLMNKYYQKKTQVRFITPIIPKCCNNMNKKIN